MFIRGVEDCRKLKSFGDSVEANTGRQCRITSYNVCYTKLLRSLFGGILKGFVPPIFLIVLVLGSILTGVATPTESSSVGGIGAILLAALYGRFSIRMVWESSLETVIV